MGGSAGSGSPGQVDLLSIHLCHQQTMRTWEYHVTSLDLSFLMCEKGTLICALHDRLWLKQGNDYSRARGLLALATTEQDKWCPKGTWTGGGAGRFPSYQNSPSTPGASYGFAPIARRPLQDSGRGRPSGPQRLNHQNTRWVGLRGTVGHGPPSRAEAGGGQQGQPWAPEREEGKDHEQRGRLSCEQWLVNDSLHSLQLGAVTERGRTPGSDQAATLLTHPHGVKCSTPISFIHTTILQGGWFCPHLTDETEAQADEMTCPQSQPGHDHDSSSCPIFSLCFLPRLSFSTHTHTFKPHSVASYCSNNKDKTTSRSGSGHATLFSLISLRASTSPTPGSGDSAFLSVLHVPLNHRAFAHTVPYAYNALPFAPS